MTEQTQLTVTAMPAGEVRMEAELAPEEIRYGVYVRGVSADGARALAAELLKAADEVERNSVPD